MPLTIAIAAYFAAAALLWGLGRRAPRTAVAASLSPFLLQLVVVGWLAVATGRQTGESLGWIPSLGVVIGFRTDALSLLLSAVVAATGLLIIIYSARYMTEPARRARFLSLMVLFAGGMAGIVASDELLGLFVFWEITTVASYLLIAFDDEEAAARAAALQAVLVTTAGGLAMLAGFVLLAVEGGTTTISELVADPPRGTITTVALLLVFLGAFTKSAQVPFHFWLPGAMAAPTPASAYLHSATMVKAGIVLLLLLAPGFAGHAIWEPVVTTIGLTTMVLGALVALRQTDLKLLLAHGTVSQLGFITALIGLGRTGAALAVLVAHAIFKAGLFLVTGAVDKATGTRDIRRLSGLRDTAPGLALTAGLVALSMAGILPLLGFVTKEAAYEELIGAEAWVALTVIALASILTVTYSGRFWFGAFGRKRAVEPTATVPGSYWLALPPAVLAAASLGLGLFPRWLESVVGRATGEKVKLVLWPGLKPALAVSAAVVVVGLVLLWAQPALERTSVAKRFDALRVPRATDAYAASVRGLNRTAERVTGVIQNGSLPVYLAVILTAVLAVPMLVWVTQWEGSPSLAAANGVTEVVLGGIVVAAAFAATRAQRRLAAALLLGVVGYAVAGIYVVFGAPDLALTQLLVETLTVGLFAFVLARLPRRFGASPRSISRSVRLGISGAVGAFVTAAAVLATTVQPDRTVAGDYAVESVEAGGRNIVNIVLTNFRALDTLGEITVLAAAAIGVSALVLLRPSPETSVASDTSGTSGTAVPVGDGVS